MARSISRKADGFYTKLLCRIASTASAITLGAILISIFAFSQPEPVWQSLLSCLGLGVVVLGASLLFKGVKDCKRLTTIIWIITALYFAILITLSVFMRYTPVWDMSALYNGAINWGVGDGLTSLNEATFDAATYYYYFPNNLGSAGALALWFRLCTLVGFTDYLFAGFILCALLSALSFAGTAFAARELGGDRACVAAMLLCGLTLPFLFSAHMFYTDFLSMPFGVMGAYCLIKTSSVKAQWKRWLYMALSALLIAIGAQLKATVFITAIAAIICIALNKNWKLLWQYTALAVSAAAISIFLLNIAVYPKQLDRPKANELNTPILHWVMMGMNGATRGAYSDEDYAFTRSFDDPDERNNAIKQEIKKRLKQNGLAGMIKLTLQKWASMYGDGTASVGDFMPMPNYDPLSGSKLEYNVKLGIYNFANAKGEYYTAYKAISNGMRLLCILLALGFAITLAIRGVSEPLQLLPLITLVGISLFLSFWEANDRYVVNILPLLVTAAACGAESVVAIATIGDNPHIRKKIKRL